MTESISQHLMKEALRQVAEWARAYLDNETCIAECSNSTLSDREKAGLLMLGMMEKD